MPERRGILVDIEGTDSSGKGTQSRLLFEWFCREGLPVLLLEFPAYHTPWGLEVARYLRGEFGPLQEVPPEVPALLYAGDRYQFRDRIRAALDTGVSVVCDRYTPSNLGYQGAKFQGPERDDFMGWIEAVESRLPPPDLVVFLRMPLKVAQMLMGGRGEKGAVEGGGRDIHEVDPEYLGRVEEVYEQLVRERENWVAVDCADGSNPLSKEEIHSRIVRLVQELLKKSG